MRLDITVYSVLLVGGLGAAYWASLPVVEGADEKVSVYAIDPKAVTEVSYKAKDVDAVAKRRDDGRFWVTHTKTEAAAPTPPKDPHKPDAKPEPAKEPKVTTETFLANDKIDDLLKAMNPLYATRTIAAVDAKQLDDFGLSDKATVFTIKGSGDKVYTLTLGKRSYGSRDRFALEGEGGKGRVILIDDSGFENLERAPLRLYDRRLVGFEFADVQKAELKVGEHTKRLAHSQRDKSGELLWTDDEEKAQPKAAYDSWMDRINKLRLTGYADPTEEASLKDAKPFLEISFEKDGKSLDRMAFFKTGGDKPVYWVTSDFLKVHGKLQPARMEPIDKDIATMMGDTKS